MPAWLLERWDREYGAEAAEGIARAALERPEEFRRGGRVMDIGSQKVAELVAARPGERVLDLCAAPGNKTAVMQETGAWVVACDASPSRLDALLAEAPRVRLDAEQPLPFGPVFDWVLVDAPCSGTGTLGRNPEIRWRLRPEDIARQAERQARMLRNALACRKPGGRVVYATCSLEREENRDVIDALGLAPLGEMHRLPGRDPGDGFHAFIL
jgi:16S rRNA (cytosine967-C5)-methyltransferase